MSKIQMKSMKAAQAGFTLLELVVVIVIVGILAAIAIPKFGTVASDARAGVISGVSGALSSANSAIYAAASVQGVTGATATVNVCGGTVAAVYGYASDMTNLTKCVTPQPAADFTIGTADIRHAKANDAATCAVTYAAPASSSALPTYTVTGSGC